MSFDYSQLDPGIVTTVKQLHQWGFQTTDSGDGVAKIDWMEEALPFKHVVCFVGPEDLMREADRLIKLVDSDWVVEAVYYPHSARAHLLLRTAVAGER